MQRLSELIALLLDIQQDLPPGEDPVVALWDQWGEEGALRQYDTVTHDTGLVRFDLTSESIVARSARQALEIIKHHEQIPAHEDH